MQKPRAAVSGTHRLLFFVLFNVFTVNISDALDIEEKGDLAGA